MFGVRGHRFQPLWEGLLVVCGNTSVKANAKTLCHFLPLAKNPSLSGTENRFVFGHFDTIKNLGQ